jgi:hypothetical protein
MLPPGFAGMLRCSIVNLSEYGFIARYQRFLWQDNSAVSYVKQQIFISLSRTICAWVWSECNVIAAPGAPLP